MELLAISWNNFVLIYFILVNCSYTFLLVISIFKTREILQRLSFTDHETIFNSRLTPAVSILVPAYNEEITIVETIKSLLLLKYPKFEVIVINDGSKDNTLETLIKSFNLKKVDKIARKSIDTKSLRGYFISTDKSNLIVIDKENGGKADALNCGINISNYPYFCAMDSDVIIENDALLRAIRPIIENKEQVIATGGIVRIANGCSIENGIVKEIKMPKKPLAIFQIIEYLRGFLTGRTGLSYLNSLLIISGAFGVFDKELVKIVGGYGKDTVGEDMELVVRLHLYLRSNKIKYKIVFVSDPVCWTEVPETLKVLGRQRNRWHRGLIDSIFRHRQMLFNYKYGVIGLFGFPFFLFSEMLSPTIELTGYFSIVLSIFLGQINMEFVILFFALTLLYGLLLSLSSVSLEEYSFHRYSKYKDLLILVLFSFLENFGYRQLNLIWRLKGTFDFLRGKKQWGQMTRKGFMLKQPIPEEKYY